MSYVPPSSARADQYPSTSALSTPLNPPPTGSNVAAIPCIATNGAWLSVAPGWSGFGGGSGGGVDIPAPQTAHGLVSMQDASGATSACIGGAGQPSGAYINSNSGGAQVAQASISQTQNQVLAGTGTTDPSFVGGITIPSTFTETNGTIFTPQGTITSGVMFGGITGGSSTVLGTTTFEHNICCPPRLAAGQGNYALVAGYGSNSQLNSMGWALNLSASVPAAGIVKSNGTDLESTPFGAAKTFVLGDGTGTTYALTEPANSGLGPQTIPSWNSVSKTTTGLVSGTNLSSIVTVDSIGNPVMIHETTASDVLLGDFTFGAVPPATVGAAVPLAGTTQLLQIAPNTLGGAKGIAGGTNGSMLKVAVNGTASALDLNATTALHQYVDETGALSMPPALSVAAAAVPSGVLAQFDATSGVASKVQGNANNSLVLVNNNGFISATALQPTTNSHEYVDATGQLSVPPAVTLGTPGAGTGYLPQMSVSSGTATVTTLVGGAHGSLPILDGGGVVQLTDFDASASTNNTFVNSTGQLSVPPALNVALAAAPSGFLAQFGAVGGNGIATAIDGSGSGSLVTVTDSNGHVGTVGFTAPYVAGTGTFLRNDGAFHSPLAAEVQGFSGTTGGLNYAQTVPTAGAVLNTSGPLNIGGTLAAASATATTLAWNSTDQKFCLVASALKYKENIVPITNGLEDFMKLRPVSYNFKSDPEKKRSFGLIADESDLIYPEPTTRVDGEIEGLDYVKFIPHMMHAIQEVVRRCRKRDRDWDGEEEDEEGEERTRKIFRAEE